MATPGAIRMGKGEVELGLDQSALQRGLMSAKATLQNFGNSVKAAGIGMMQMGIAMAIPLALGVREFANYEQALADLTAAGGNEAIKNFDAIKAGIETVAKRTGTGLVEVTSGFSELIKAGIPINAVLGGLGETAVKFARVSGMAMADTAVILADSMNIFSREGLSAAQVTDIMNAAADGATISLRQVAEAFGGGASVAGQYNQSMRDVAIAVGILGNAGIKGSEAGGMIRRLMLNLNTGATATDEAGQAFRELGLNVRDAQGNMIALPAIIAQIEEKTRNMSIPNRDRLFASLGGTYGVTGLLALTSSGSVGWERFSEAMASSLPVAQKFDIMTNTLWGSLAKLWVHIQLVAVEVGSALAPALSAIGAVLLPVLDVVASFIKQNRELVQMFAFDAAKAILFGAALVGLGIAISFAGTLFGFAATALWTLGAALAVVGAAFAFVFSPVGLAVIAAIATAATLLSGNFSILGDALAWIMDSPIGAFVNGVIDAAMALWAMLTGLFDTLVTFFTDSGIAGFLTDILKVVAGIMVIYALFNGLIVWLVYLGVEWVLTSGIIGKAWEAVVTIFTEGVAIIRRVIGYLAMWIRFQMDIVRSVLGYVFGGLMSIGTTAISTIGNAFATVSTQIVESFSAAWASTAEGFATMFGEVVATGTQAWGAIQNAFATGNWAMIWDIVRVSAMLAWENISFFLFSTFDTWKDALFDTFHNVWLAIKSSFVTIWGEVKATMFEALREVALAAASVAVGPMVGIFEARALEFRIRANNARVRAEADVRDMAGAALFDAAERDVARILRDAAAAAGHGDEVRRLQGELDFLDAEADVARLVAEINAPQIGGGPGRNQIEEAGNQVAAAKSVVMGSFGAQAIMGFLGTSRRETAAERQQRQMQDLLDQNALQLAALQQIAREVRARFA